MTWSQLPEKLNLTSCCDGQSADCSALPGLIPKEEAQRCKFAFANGPCNYTVFQVTLEISDVSLFFFKPSLKTASQRLFFFLLRCHQQYIHEDSGRCRPQSKVQGYLFERLLCSLFDLSFCLVRAALPLRLPYACFSFLFCSSCTLPLEVAWRIQLDMPRADSQIETASLSFSFFFTATGVLLPREPHNTFCHLTFQCSMPPHPCCHPQFQLWCNTAPTGKSGFFAASFSPNWRKQTVIYWLHYLTGQSWCYML